MSNNIRMCTIGAIKHLRETEGLSKYRIAKLLEVNANMIDHYLAGTKMRKNTASRFQLAFGIEVTDVFEDKAK